MDTKDLLNIQKKVHEIMLEISEESITEETKVIQMNLSNVSKELNKLINQSIIESWKNLKIKKL